MGEHTRSLYWELDSHRHNEETVAEVSKATCRSTCSLPARASQLNSGVHHRWNKDQVHPNLMKSCLCLSCYFSKTKVAINFWYEAICRAILCNHYGFLFSHAHSSHDALDVVDQYTCIDLNAKVWKVFKPQRHIILCTQELTIANYSVYDVSIGKYSDLPFHS